MKQEKSFDLLSLSNIGNAFIQGILITDKDGIILYINDENEKIFQISKREAIGHNVSEFTTTDQKQIINASSIMGITEKNIFHAICTIPKTKMATLQYTAPIYDDNHEIQGYVITDTNIEKYKKIVNILETSDSKQLSDEEIQKDEFFKRTNPLIHPDFPALIQSGNERYSKALKLARQSAKSDISILLLGETGCGKEVFANYINSLSPRNNKPFLKINCSALPANLLESELFGYEKGSFTGASTKGKPGLFELANTGTLLLDEIGDLPLEFQVKLLRVLQEKQVTRIGGTRSIDLDIKLIFATNQNLREMVKKGTFREDLYYRISILPIVLPPLRERLEDLEELTRFFLDKFNKKHNKHVSFSPLVYSNLKKYAWPGNIRELQNMIERWVIIFDAYSVIRWNQISSSFLDSDYMLDYNVDAPKTLMTYNEIMDEYQRDVLLWAKKQYKTTREMAAALDLDHSTISKKAKRLGINLKTDS